MTEKDKGKETPREGDDGDERKEEEREVVVEEEEEEEEEEEGRTHSENGQSHSRVDLEEDGREMQSVDEDAQTGKDSDSTSAERRESRTLEKLDSAVSAAATDDVSLFPPTIDKEKRRKVAAAKRANEESLQSARERYLARKRAKLTAPVISDD